MSRRMRTVLCLMCAASLSAWSASVAAADPPGRGGPGGHGGPPHGPALYVSPSATTGAADRSCQSAAYTSVQAAVQAARPGQLVYLCGSVPYRESVLIDKDLRLGGDPGATIQAPAGDASPATSFFSNQGLLTPNAVLTILGDVHVRVQGLQIEGPFDNSGCTPDDFGILDIGATVQIIDDRVLDIRASDQAGDGGCQYGIAVQVGRRYWPSVSGSPTLVNFSATAQILNSYIAGYQKNGITVDGAGSSAQIRGNTIQGGGQTAAIARNGVQVSRGATGQVVGNLISGNEYTGPGSFAAATGVLVYGGCGDPLSSGVLIARNALVDNDAGIDVSEFDPTCSQAPSSPTDTRVVANEVVKSDGETNQSPFTAQDGSSYTAYQVGIADTGNGDSVVHNAIVGTVASGADTAFGPLTTPGGPFLAPIDVQTYPPLNASVQGNVFDGAPTSPPY
ncbi:MAG TPA: right-handed parallel beta-helix repeat-containing protein [Solirubrobacteraceae bacterium]|nr:right-handed parallel beta-helix repeat-containing protein [Solirubrobacteraceae bacterium]